MLSKLRPFQYSIQLLFASALLFALTIGVKAQSLDAATPTPIRSTNLIGKIAARDLGDSRLTDHYYAFTGTPGDLMITIQSRNLNGDLDVFTAGSLRPLLKLTLYAENATPVTKGIYLRKRENLILRIEARSPNDDEGTYQLFFGGSFEPIAGGSEIAESETPATETANPTGSRGTKRVSSVGARLPEPEKPVTEVAAAPTPTPEVTERVEEPKPKPSPKTRTTTAANTPRTRRPTPRSTTPKPKPDVVASTDETNKSEETKNSEESAAATETPKTRPTTSRATPRRGNTAANRAAKPKSETPVETTPEPEIGPRLVIETSDGTLINRSMSTVRRVVVENGQVVVTAKDGKIDRIPLTNVVRMSIAP